MRPAQLYIGFYTPWKRVRSLPQKPHSSASHERVHIRTAHLTASMFSQCVLSTPRGKMGHRWKQKYQSHQSDLVGYFIHRLNLHVTSVSSRNARMIQNDLGQQKYIRSGIWSIYMYMLIYTRWYTLGGASVYHKKQGYLPEPGLRPHNMADMPYTKRLVFICAPQLRGKSFIHIYIYISLWNGLMIDDHHPIIMEIQFTFWPMCDMPPVEWKKEKTQSYGTNSWAPRKAECLTTWLLFFKRLLVSWSNCG